MTATEKLLAARKVLEYAKSLGFTESYIKLYPDCDPQDIEGFERALWETGVGERTCIDMALELVPNLEVVGVDVVQEEFEKLGEAEREKVRERLNSDDYTIADKAQDELAPYDAIRFLPDGPTIKCGFRERMKLPKEFRDIFKEFYEGRRASFVKAEEEEATK